MIVCQKNSQEFVEIVQNPSCDLIFFGWAYKVIFERDNEDEFRRIKKKTPTAGVVNSSLGGIVNFFLAFFPLYNAPYTMQHHNWITLDTNFVTVKNSVINTKNVSITYRSGSSPFYDEGMLLVPLFNTTFDHFWKSHYVKFLPEVMFLTIIEQSAPSATSTVSLWFIICGEILIIITLVPSQSRIIKGDLGSCVL